MQRRRSQDNNDSISQTVGFLEKLEFYVFVVVASGTWCFLAYYTLRTLKFPFHAHPYETFGIFVGPIVLIILILKLIEGRMRIKDD